MLARGAPLTSGLQSLVMFDEPPLIDPFSDAFSGSFGGNFGGGSVAVSDANFLDYAMPYQTFSYSGNGSQAAAFSPYGGIAILTDGNSTTDAVSYGLPLIATAIWSFSARIKFNGTNASAFSSGAVALCSNAAGTAGIAVASGVGDFCDFASSAFLTPPVNTWSTWTRLTFTSDGTTTTLYADGAKQSTATLTATNFALGKIVYGWPWPVDDFFWWQNRTLTASEVMTHHIDPYGSTLQLKIPLPGRPPNPYNIPLQLAPTVAQ